MRPLLAPFAVVLVVAGLVAQAKVVSPVEKRARSLCNQLELVDRRVAAAEELLALGAAAVPALAARIADPRPEVVQVVCEVLCALGTTAASALPQLVTAIGSPNPAIVRMARMTELRVRTTGATTISECEGQRIVKIAADGTEQVLLTGETPYGVDPLPDDHLLVAQPAKKRIVEYDGQGKEVWSYECQMPTRASRLLDGHTLIAETQRRIVEVDSKGVVAWEWQAPGGKIQACDADRLANGRTLIVLYPDRVVEVDRAGEVVWKLEGLEGVFEADRLLNGNTLLCLFRAGEVREVNPKGEVVWEVKVKGPRDANRLPNGNTLVGAETGVVEFGPDGTKVAETCSGKVIFGVIRH